ncbi:MAG: potassium channel family protein, partial [Deltaproteobacteria bacterium]|nr:potassium channel family protein [Deltaproteobacteria bacterium]
MIKRWIATTVRHAGTLLLLPVLLIGIGTGGYMILQGFSFIEALYMTVITLATVGFGEVKPLDETGRIFTILLILTGAAFVAYQLAYFSRLMLDVDLMDLYRRRKLKKNLEQLQDHYVVCGYGQMGQIIVDELAKSGMSVVVVDNDESLIVRLREKGILHLAGDATEEENLLEAGIRRAKGLVSVVNKDTDNVFIVLTARDLNKDMSIFARAGTPYTEKRLFQ